MHSKMPNDTTTAVQHPPKAQLGVPTISWLRPSSFTNIAVRTLGNGQVQRNRGQFHHDLKSTTFTDREQ